MKVFEYQDDSWWDDNGCDCCPKTLIPCYNLLNSEHEYYVYSCHTEEDCWRQALELEGIIDEDLDFDHNEIDFELMCFTMITLNLMMFIDNCGEPYEET